MDGWIGLAVGVELNDLYKVFQSIRKSEPVEKSLD